ncbi:hypothetical protein acsn021_20770 [Anaerocolumna cellulosilytica]|uniref:Uncharacterized protein n=1 Tax=Anaerocolumna cellulosilytica TaxID=433286 RepID=A0A6S6R658_9FIRM|nr:metallopeptidase TldD-related protein [Anaerocolumna cellulosilytica]MBB5194280.1 PmbA protein [Anaerocolumna cellulosilytica]BCJ94508.1 hypothetical protein acsn021_20770 [Anaerocolumna cellulosilytica]
MIKELYKTIQKETQLIITQSKIDAVMKKNITKSGCRVYDNGCIGVAGTLGEATEATWEEAVKNLKKKIAYPYEVEQNKIRTRDLRKLTISDEEFIAVMEGVLGTLKSEFPEFILSHKILIVETEEELKNDAGLHYRNLDKTVQIGLLVKHVDSLDIIDSAIMFEGRELDLDSFLFDARAMLRAFTIKAEVPKQDKVPIIIQTLELNKKLTQSLNGEAVGHGTSIFCDKIGKKAFSSSFHYLVDRSEKGYHRPFFDAEGVTIEGDRLYLIKDGVLERPFTDKKQAGIFSYQLTSTSSGSYDEVPSLDYPALTIEAGDKKLKELLNGELGILVIFISGGEYTNDGNFASPVQMSYLTDGEKLYGRLPELNITGNLYEIFGEDYLGVTNDKVISGEEALVVRMKVHTY